MLNTVKNIFASILIVPMIALGISAASNVGVFTQTANATDYSIKGGATAAKGADQADNLFSADGLFTKITNAALFLIGAVSVLMLIYGGIRYTISGGESSAVTAAKNTILYAIVGIVVAILAYAIVQFVIGTLIPS